MEFKQLTEKTRKLSDEDILNNLNIELKQ